MSEALLHVTILADLEAGTTTKLSLAVDAANAVKPLNGSQDLVDVGTTVESLRKFLTSNPSIVHVTLEGQGGAEGDAANTSAQALVQKVVQNSQLTQIVLNLQNLDVAAVLTSDLSFANDSCTLMLGLGHMSEPADTAALTAQIAALQPSELGVALQDSCPDSLVEAVLAGLADNQAFQSLVLESVSASTAQVLATKLINTGRIASLGLPKGALTPTAAQILLEAVQDDAPSPQSLILSGSTFDTDCELINLMQSLVSHKFTRLVSFNVGQNEFADGALSQLVGCLASHPTLTQLAIQDVSVVGDADAAGVAHGWTTFFSENTTCQTIHMDGTPLAAAAVDEYKNTTWKALAKNSTLQTFSLQHSIPDVPVWKDVYQAMVDDGGDETPVVLHWNMTADATQLKMNRGAALEIVLAKPSEDDCDVVCKAVKEWSQAKHTVTIEPQALTNSPRLGKLLPIIMMNKTVVSLDLTTQTQGECLELLKGVLAFSSGELTSLTFDWK